MHLMYFTEQPMSAYPVEEGRKFGNTALMFSNRHFDPVAGTDDYILSAPIFEQARITVDGHELVIVATGASSEKRYVAGVSVDDLPLDKPELCHAA